MQDAVKQDNPKQDAVEQEQGEATGKSRSADRLWTGTFVVIVVLTFLIFIAAQGVNSSISTYISIKGGSAALSGVLAAVFSLSAAAARIVFGPFIDRIGRRPFLIAGFAFFLAGLAGPLLNSSFPAFVLWRTLQGIGFSAVTSAASTAAADVLALSRLGEGIGYQTLGQAVAMSVGPAIGLWLVGTDPAENVFVGLIIISSVGLFLSFACAYERHPERLPHTSAYFQRVMREKRRERAAEEHGGPAGSADSDGFVDSAAPAGSADSNGSGDSTAATASADAADTSNAPGTPVAPEERGLRRFFEPAALPGVLAILPLSLVFGMSIYFCGLYGNVLHVGNPGLYFTLSAITMILVRVAGKSFMDNIGPFWLHLIAAVCGAIAMGMLLLAAWVPVLYYIAGFFYGVCMGLAAPVNQAVVVKCSPAHRWGVANSFYFLTQDVGIGAAAVLWGVINDSFGFGVSFALAIGCAVLSAAIAWFVYPGHGVSPLKARGVE